MLRVGTVLKTDALIQVTDTSRSWHREPTLRSFPHSADDPSSVAACSLLAVLFDVTLCNGAIKWQIASCIGDGIATRIQTGRFIVRFPEVSRDLSLLHIVVTRSGAHLANENRGSLPGLKQPGHEFDPSSPSTAEVKNEWSHTSIPPIWLYGVARKIFNFTSIAMCLYNGH
jgi:hypothetical protein